RRAQAFSSAVEQSGLPAVVDINVGAARTLKSGRAALRTLLERDAGVDAIFCSSDLLAIGALTEARARGIQIPDDIAIIGFGDVPFVADMVPALTTVHIKGAAIG